MIKKLILSILFILLLAACGGDTPAAEEIVAPTSVTAPTSIPATAVAVVETGDSDGGDSAETQAPTAAPAVVNTSVPEPTLTAAPPEPTAEPTKTPVPTVPREVEIEIPGAQLPQGFSLIKFAEMERATGIAIDAEGRLFVTTQAGEIIVLADEDGDGRADLRKQFSFGWDEPFGVAFHPDNDDIYVSSAGKISIMRDFDNDLVADEAVNLVKDLPYNQHRNNNLKFGPDGMLYMGLGSTCDVCYEEDPRSATVMRFDPTTGEQEVVATGLRNAFDIAFHPETGALFSTENGRDDLGPENPWEELNHIVDGADYGFPDCWNNLEGPGCEGTTVATGFFEARSSTNSIDFYDQAGFPAEYQNNLFAAVWGSYVAEVKRGIWHVELVPEGDTYKAQMKWFADWPNSWLLGLAVSPDGAIYVGDYTNGGIYRISYGLP